LEASFGVDGPVSAEQIAEAQNLDLTSVYRNLETLELQGIARHVHLGHGPGLYVLIGSGEHEYLYCERCGAVEALSPEQLDPVRQRVREQFGYQARFTHFAIVGTCPACTNQQQRKASSQRSTPASRATSGEQHEHEHNQGDHAHPHAKGRKEQHEHRH
jgi:Fur family ferric uptake transcriptional regulator